MDINSNKYTFIFSAAMVVIVATVLAVAAESLKPFQQLNIEREKMQNILAACGISVERNEAKDAYEKYIGEANEMMLNAEGKIVESPDVRPFDVDPLQEYKSGGQRHFPIFVCNHDGKEFQVIPMVGKGLWGPIWGYVAISSDYNTVTGATFDHKGETPGLGAEINTDWFQEEFIGKKIFDENGNFQSIKVMKGGAPEGDPHAVDAISGGTITSNGVTEMLSRTFKAYEPYLKSKMNS